METIILYTILGIIGIELIISKTLDYLNGKTWNLPLPKEVADLYNEAEYKKAIAYDKAKGKIGAISSAISTLILIGLLLTGGFAHINDFIGHYYSNDSIIQPILFFGVLGLGSTILNIPFSIYNTFVIEEKFGFNKTTAKTFVLDIIKGLFIGALLGGGLLWLFLWFYTSFPELFWLYAWIAFSIITLLFAAFYTDLIVPLFNKLSPLEEGPLRTEIENFAQKVNFPLTNIMVVDGSKRSTKANAYFSGIGKRKKIVLYDTLIEEQTTEELTAVLAHEVGHYKKKHIIGSMIISILNMGVLLFILKLSVGTPELSFALGAEKPSIQLGLIAFTMLYSPISMITGLFMNGLSRKNEYEADKYAADNYNGEALITALKKLSVTNLTNLNPHNAYVWFHYSHPTLLQRMRAIRK